MLESFAPPRYRREERLASQASGARHPVSYPNFHPSIGPRLRMKIQNSTAGSKGAVHFLRASPTLSRGIHHNDPEKTATS